MNELYENLNDEEKTIFRNRCIMEFGYTERTFYNRVGGCGARMRRFEAIKMTELWLEIAKKKAE